jgi:hypothetical protein
MSYLAGVKTKLELLVKALEEEVAKSDPSEFPAIFAEWRKEGWSFFEKCLKRSYANGRNEAGGPPRPKAKEAAEKVTRRFAGVILDE